MGLPDLTASGDLPPGLHRATLDEVIARFGGGTIERQEATDRLSELVRLVRTTGKLVRLLVFGTYVTSEPRPNDVDLFVIMAPDFDVDAYSGPTRSVFSHAQADREFGASVFWARYGMNTLLINDLIEGWQIKRDRTRRGIVEIVE
jgi:hypothetical protein